MKASIGWEPADGTSGGVTRTSLWYGHPVKGLSVFESDPDPDWVSLERPAMSGPS